MELEVQLADGRHLSVVIDKSPWIINALPRLGWRKAGQHDWVESIATFEHQAKDSDGAVSVDLRFAEVAKLSLTMRRVDAQTWEIRGQLHNSGSESLELARFHYLHGELVAPAGLLAPSPHFGSCRLTHRGEAVPPMKQQTESSWGDALVQWPRMADPIHVQADWALAVDTGIFTPAWDQPGLHLGFTGPVGAFGETGLHTTAAKATCFAGLLLDGIRLDPGQTRMLDTLRIRAGDWEESMRGWAKACADAVGVKPVRAPLVGYCSWYQFASGILPEHISQANREFTAWPCPPGGRTIQIDDGFQVMPGDWRPNSRFKEVWKQLPAEIAKNGSIPGLWLAPHLVFHRHELLSKHPDWFQRMADGSLAVSFSNWSWCATDKHEWGNTTEPTYGLDIDHPGAQQFMFDIVADAVNAGWKYLKIDFAYALSTARKPWNPYKTRMESLRDLFSLFRKAAGDDTIICACIGEMGRYALGSVDTARVGGDIGGNWDSIRTNLPDTLIRMSTNGHWWNVDPDVFHLRQENTEVSDEESSCLTRTIGMIGGVFLTSDFASQWSVEAQKQAQIFWNNQGPQIPTDFHVVYSFDGIPLAIRFSYTTGSATRHSVAVYNWSDQPETLRVPLAMLGFRQADDIHQLKLHPDGVRIDSQDLVCENLPPHSLRIVNLN